MILSVKSMIYGIKSFLVILCAFLATRDESFTVIFVTIDGFSH